MSMLELTRGQSNEQIIVTLSELTAISGAYWLFVFTHITTKNVVTFIPVSDLSPYPARYNLFNLDASVVFNEQPYGLWDYVVYQQDNNTNTDPALTGGAVEYGKLRLFPVSEFAFEKYDQPVTFKAYNG